MKEYFANADAGLFGLLIFFIFFVTMLIWLFRPGSAASYKKFGNIPLKDSNDER